MSYIALTLGFTALFAVLSFHKEYKTTWSILCAVVFVLFGVINYNTLPVLQWCDGRCVQDPGTYSRRRS